MLLEHYIDTETGELVLRGYPPAVYSLRRLRELHIHIAHLLAALLDLEKDATIPPGRIDAALLQSVYALAAELYVTARGRALALDPPEKPRTVELDVDTASMPDVPIVVTELCKCKVRGPHHGCACLAETLGVAHSSDQWCICPCHLPVSTT